MKSEKANFGRNLSIILLSANLRLPNSKCYNIVFLNITRDTTILNSLGKKDENTR